MAKKKLNPTLIVGLGGTGQNVLKNVKRNLLKKYGEIPSLIQFLEIDTDPASGNREVFEFEFENEKRQFDITLVGNEFLTLNGFTWDRFFEQKKDTLEKFVDFPKVKSDSTHLSVGAGANGVRWVSKLRLMNDISAVKSRLTEKLNFLTNSQNLTSVDEKYDLSNQGKVFCHVIGSVAGGTGSGLCIDIPYLIRSIHNDPINTKIYGYFADYSFYEGLPSTFNIKNNTFAAFSELEYLMSCKHAEDQKGQLNFFFDNGFDGGTKSPYDGFYCFSNKNLLGVSLTKDVFFNALGATISNCCGEMGDKLASIFVNTVQGQKEFSYENKLRLFSSIGYAELVFNRQSFVDYIIKDKIIDSLQKLQGSASNSQVLSALDFIKNNGLYEGSTVSDRKKENTLIDAIFNLDMALPDNLAFNSNIKPEKSAKEKLEAEKNVFYSNLTAWYAKESKDAYLLSEKKKLLGDYLSKLLTSQNGIEAVKAFVVDLNIILTDMKNQLADELNEHKNELEVINTSLEAQTDFISKKGDPGFLHLFGASEKELKESISKYCFLVENPGDKSTNTFRRVSLEVFRKNSAIKIFTALQEVLGEYWKKKSVDDPNQPFEGKVVTYRNLMDVLIPKLQAEISDYQRNLAKSTLGVTKLEFTLNKYYLRNREKLLSVLVTPAFDITKLLAKYIDNLDPKMDTLIEEIKVSIEQNRSGFLSTIVWDDKKENSVEKIISELFLGLSNDVNVGKGSGNNEVDKELSYSVDITTDLFKNLFIMNSAPLYKHEYTGTTDSHIDQELGNIYLVGVYEDSPANPSIFSKGHKSGINSNFLSGHEPVEIRDRDRIIVIRTQQAVPGFLLNNMDSLHAQFENLKDNAWFYTDKRISDAKANLFPSNVSNDAYYVWAMAWMLGFIFRDSNRYKLNVSPEYVRKYNVLLDPKNNAYDYFDSKGVKKPSDLEACFNCFASDKGLMEDLRARIIAKRDDDREAFKGIVKAYINKGDLRGPRRGKETFTPDELVLMQKEEDAIMDSLSELSSKGARIESKTMDDGRRLISYNDNL